MRLIDADALIEKMNVVKFQTNISEESNRYRPFLDYADVLGCINEQPTAYDAEKVVAELEEMIKPKQFYFCKYAKGGCKYIDDDKKDCTECVVEHAIDIVRKGGAV